MKRSGWRVGISIGFALLSAACGESMEDLHQDAAELQAGGQYRAALGTYRSVLELAPGDARARLGVAENNLYLGEYSRAITALERATLLDVKAERVAPLLVTALLAGDQHQAVIDRIDPEGVENAGVRAELHAKRAEAFLALGEQDSAMAEARAATAAMADSSHALTAYAWVALAQGQRDAARQTIQRVLASGERPAAALRLAARLAQQSGDMQRAMRYLAEGAERPPTDRSASLRDRFLMRAEHVELLVQQDEIASAGEVVAMMERQAANHPYTHYLAGLIAFRTGQLDEAVERLQAVLSRSPDNPQAKTLMGTIRLEQGRYPPAVALFGEVLAKRPDDVSARLRLVAALRESAADTRATEVLIEGVQRAGEDPRALARLLGATQSDRDIDALIDAVEQYSPGIEESPDARGIEILRRQFLTILRLRSGDVEGAGEAAQALVAEYPESVAALNLLGGMDLAAGRIDAARQSFERALILDGGNAQAQFNLRVALERARVLSPDDPRIQYELARARAVAGDEAGAKTLLQAVIDASPAYLRGYPTLIRLHLDAGDREAALSVARRFREQSGGGPAGALWVGRIEQAAGRDEAALEAYAAAVALGNTEGLPAMVDLRAGMRHPAPALPFEIWLEENPSAGNERIALANWYLQRARYADAIRHYEVLVEQTDRGAPGVLNNLAWLYSQVGDERAVSTAEAAYTRASGSVVVQDTLGWIYFGAGRVDEALELLAQAAGRAPDVAEIQYHYGAALTASGERERAQRVLERALELQGTADWAESARGYLDRP